MSVSTINNTYSYTFFHASKKMNNTLIILIVFFGIIGNLTTIVLLLTKSEKSKNKTIWKKSFSSSQFYMLFLAISDLLFLFSHLLEDSLPTLSDRNFFQFVNRYSIVCKLTLYFRNATRISSAYLVVLFAWERYVIISSPLKRLKLLSIQNTRYTIFGIFAFSIVITGYTPFISGLRSLDSHEITGSLHYECDTLKDFKTIYDYVISFYIIVSMGLPIILIFSFNISIVYILLTRKEAIFKQSFSPIGQSG